MQAVRLPVSLHYVVVQHLVVLCILWLSGDAYLGISSLL